MAHSHPHSHASGANTPAQDVALAQQALHAGDLHHALFHVASALSTHPTQAQWLALQDAILRRADRLDHRRGAGGARALARGAADVRRDVDALFAWLERQIPDAGYTCFEYPLVVLRLWLGGLDPQTEQRLRADHAALEAPHDEDEHEQEDDEGDPEGLTLAGYAEFVARRDAIVARHAQAGGIGAGRRSMGALAKDGLPTCSDLQVVGDPGLNARFGKMMAG